MRDGSILLTSQLGVMQRERLEYPVRAKRIREAVDASPIFQGMCQGLDRLSKLSKGELTYAIIYKDERPDEPNSWDTVAELETNLILSGTAYYKPFFKPGYLKKFSSPISFALKADGQISSIGFTDVRAEAGQSIYPVPKKKRFAFQQAKIDAANEESVGKALEFVARIAFQKELVPVEALAAAGKPKLPKTDPISPLDTLRSKLKTPSAEQKFWGCRR